MPFIKKMCALFASWVLIFSPAYAQNQPLSRESLLANPDILWLGETQAFVWLDSLENIDCAAQKNIYQNAACTEILTHPYERKINIYYIWGAEDEPMIEIRDTASNCSNQYEIRILVYYNLRERAFSSLVTAISPLVNEYDDNGNFLYIKPICWFKTALMVSDIEKNPHFYAQYDCLLENVQVLKSTQTLTECLDMQLICAEEEAEKMRTFGHPQDSSHLSSEALRERLLVRDTTLSIEHGDAYVWTVVCNTRLNPTEISKISFFMRWAWDANTQQIYCKNLLYAPILKHPRKPNFYEVGADTATHQTERVLFWKSATN